jgi:hypothetical protein
MKKKAPFFRTGLFFIEQLSEARSALCHRLQAFHAYLDLFRRSLDHGLDGTKIGKEYPLVFVMSVRNGIAGHGVFAADFACLCHTSSWVKLVM